MKFFKRDLFKLITNHHGMSLIEVLIATVLLAFIMMGVISTTNNSFDTKESVVSEDRVKVQIHTAISRMARDFQRIYSPLYFSPRLVQPKKKDEAYNESMQRVMERYRRNDRYVFPDNSLRPVPRIISEGGKDIEFITTSHFSYIEGQNQSDYAWVKYELVTDPNPQKDANDQKRSASSLLIRKVDPNNPFSEERVAIDEAKAHTVLEFVSSLAFEFWDSKNRKFVTSIRELRQDSDKYAPRAIKMILEWEPFAGDVQVIEKIFRPLYPAFKISDQELKYLQEAVDGKFIKEGRQNNEEEGV
jgi:prepilin-type N-terminal cleavage/methylation domain-containing protein